jgi:hypothetical protein
MGHARPLDNPARQGLGCAPEMAIHPDSDALPTSVRAFLSEMASLGGHARARKLSKRRRREIATKASMAAKRARARRRRRAEETKA